MASTRERSDSADILPRPELNPLLNPILSDNMGRWAEVYFTSPPERREEAVLELLHELENGQKNAETRPVAPDASATNPMRHVLVEPEKVWEQISEHRFCSACGSENPRTHQFCGMCGARLQQDSSVSKSAAADVRDPDSLGIRFAQERAPGGESGESDEQGRHVAARNANDDPSFYAPAAGSDELSLFQSFRSPEPEDDWDYEPPHSSSYRFYIAAVLLIVIGALGYMAWRGSQTAQSSHQVSPPPPASVTESAQPSTPAQQASNAPQAATPAEQSAPPTSAPEAAATTPVPVKTVSSAKNKAAERQAAEGTAPPVPAEMQAAAQPASSGGTEELAMAERYLNGSIGQGRNSSEAATWLWKSIAKHNGQATVLLADLYLRGDGVSKNCEQGRVLLDSAAQKGVPGAGDQLRNLQAFGCH